MRSLEFAVSTHTTRPAAACLEGRYTKLPDTLLSVLTPRQHMLVHALLSYKWFSDSSIYPSVPTLAKQLRWSVRTVQRIMRQLEAGGWIVVRACYRSDDGQASNLYEPGPVLLPYLSPAPARPDTTPVTKRHPAPVSPVSDERDDSGITKEGKNVSQSGERPSQEEASPPVGGPCSYCHVEHGPPECTPWMYGGR